MKESSVVRTSRSGQPSPKKGPSAGGSKIREGIQLPLSNGVAEQFYGQDVALQESCLGRAPDEQGLLQMQFLGLSHDLQRLHGRLHVLPKERLCGFVLELGELCDLVSAEVRIFADRQAAHVRYTSRLQKGYRKSVKNG